MRLASPRLSVNVNTPGSTDNLAVFRLFCCIFGFPAHCSRLGSWSQPLDPGVQTMGSW